jgi:hypothetical protein
LKKEEPLDKGGVAYNVLVEGGALYVGTVLTITVTRSNPAGPDGPAAESGTFEFLVDKTVIGPARKNLTLGYWWMSDDPNEQGAAQLEWVCNSGPWRQRPQVGDRLLLLLTGNQDDAEHMNGKDGGPVWQVWRDVTADHPLVKSFEVAGNYLEVQYDDAGDELFKKLCQSEWPSIRSFAWEAAFLWMSPLDHVIGGFGYDPQRQSRRVVQLLEFYPKGDDDDGRGAISRGLRGCSTRSSSVPFAT